MKQNVHTRARALSYGHFAWFRKILGREINERDTLVRMYAPLLHCYTTVFVYYEKQNKNKRRQEHACAVMPALRAKTTGK